MFTKLLRAFATRYVKIVLRARMKELLMNNRFLYLIVTIVLFGGATNAQPGDSTSFSRTTFSYSCFHYLEPPSQSPFQSVTGFLGLRIGHEFDISRHAYSLDLGIDGASNTWAEYPTPDVAKRGISVYLTANRVLSLRSDEESISISAYLGMRLSYAHYWAEFYQYDPNAITGDQRRASQKLVGSESQTVQQFGPNIRTKVKFVFLPVKLELGYAPTVLAFTNSTLQFKFSHMFEMLLTL